jgi:CelD/BcsL family acetyltransferase involved in cellulose biosynthesis
MPLAQHHAANLARVAGDSVLRLTVAPWNEWPRLARVWSELAEVSPHYSFFLSAAWVETWLGIFGPALHVSLALFEEAGEAVGVCLLAESRVRRALIPIRRICLNASGEAADDTTYIEFNGLLCRAGWERKIAESLAARLSEENWDTFAVDGFAVGPAYEALKQAFAGLTVREIRHPSYFVDLARLRSRGIAYQETLSGVFRKHLRRSLRSYSELGSLRLEIADTLEDALGMLDELATLSRERWNGRAGSPVFESPLFMTFHRNLIRTCFERQSVQLLRLVAGSRTVGLVYNFVDRGRVYFYQCGFDYSIRKSLSPGTVTLALVIQRCIDMGLSEFDFLSGEADYKRRLATGARELVWCEFQRPSLKLRLLDLARSGARHLLRRRGGGAPVRRNLQTGISNA